ncbi:MAG: GNAT family N-acetyltransferase [Ignavibacteriae bacterium]|nr:GNAT family N-acetyltransferase [Ignavibacteriota bacterium]MCB9243317.1 GNAT family N-acetyltransferase [Ignavibacteriales bacterium]
MPEGFTIRLAKEGDEEGIAVLRHEREGGEYDELLAQSKTLVREGLDIETTHVFIAEIPGLIIGFCIMRYFIPGDDAPVNTAPGGWYLLGINVKKEYRRRGVGTELIRVRLKFIPGTCDTAYYFTNPKNFTSQAFHSRFGFEEIKEDIVYPKRKPTTIYYRIDLDELRKRNFEIQN